MDNYEPFDSLRSDSLRTNAIRFFDIEKDEDTWTDTEPEEDEKITNAE